MKYIIDKHDLYLKQEEPLIVSLNDIVTTLVVIKSIRSWDILHKNRCFESI